MAKDKEDKGKIPDSPPGVIEELPTDSEMAAEMIKKLTAENEKLTNEIKLLTGEIDRLNSELKELRSAGSPTAIPKGAIVIPAGDPYVAGVWRFILNLRKIPRNEWLGYESQTLVLDPSDPQTVPALENYIARCASADPGRAAEMEAELKRVVKFQKRKR